MNLPSVVDRRLPPAFLPGQSARVRGGEERRGNDTEAASTVRVSPVARQLRGDEQDPTLDAARRRSAEPTKQVADELRKRLARLAGLAPEPEGVLDPVLARASSLAEELRPHSARPGSAQPNPARPDAAQPDAAQPDAGTFAGDEGEGGPRRDRPETSGEPSTGGRTPRRAGTASLELSQEDARRVNELRARDREVRSHEQAHISAANGLAGSPKFELKSGPDGRQYAVNGEVSIDVSPGRTPQETLKRAATIRAAASAPAQPSGQDQNIAARAAQMAADARVELARKEAEARAPRESSGAPAPSEPPAEVPDTTNSRRREDVAIAADAQRREELRTGADTFRRDETVRATDARRREKFAATTETFRREEAARATDALRREEIAAATDARRREEIAAATDANSREFREQQAAKILGGSRGLTRDGAPDDTASRTAFEPLEARSRRAAAPPPEAGSNTSSAPSSQVRAATSPAPRPEPPPEPSAPRNTESRRTAPDANELAEARARRTPKEPLGADPRETERARDTAANASATPAELTFRPGGVSGGHMHATLQCSFCSAGIAAYRGRVG